MKVTLAVDPGFVGMVDDYTERENNMDMPFMSTVEKVVSVFRDGDVFEVTEGAVNIINMDSSNILMNRVCKKTASEIAEIIRNMKI